MTNLTQNTETNNKFLSQYLEFPIELLNQLGTNEKLTREVSYSHGVSNEYSNHLFYCTMYEGKRYKTTLEQKQQAEKLYQVNKQKVIDSIGNKLVFVGMGMEYAAKYEDDVCNHRVRTEIINPNGRRFFIEVGTGRGESMHIHHVVDRDQEYQYNEKANYYRNLINNNGGFWKIGKGHPDYEQYQKYQSQPYYWYKKDQWFSLNTKYTKENVLKLVNSLFECNFTQIDVDYNHLTTDDYVSTSPKFN